MRVARVAAVLVGAGALLTGAFYIGGGWYFSGVIAESTLDASAHRQALVTHSYTIPVLATGLSAPGEAYAELGTVNGVPELLTEGTWGVHGPDGGFAQIGRIIARTPSSVTRVLVELTGPPIRTGEKLELVNDSFPADPTAALGIPYENVTYPGPLGTYPAWFIPGTAPDWAVLVHGDALSRQDTLEPMQGIHRAGLPMLVISYRNDPGAPWAKDGLVRYGQTEWRDLEAAVNYALGHGARNVLLVGRSMGGAVVVSFLEKSELAPRVKAVVLDAPMLDFSRAVDHAATQRTLPVLGLPIPSSLVATAKLMTSVRYGVDWEALNYLAQDSKLHAPILLFHGTADQRVPAALSEQLAADRPDLVTYVPTPGAGHLDSWNLDPARYDSYVERFAAAHAAD